MSAESVSRGWGWVGLAVLALGHCWAEQALPPGVLRKTKGKDAEGGTRAMASLTSL